MAGAAGRAGPQAALPQTHTPAPLGSQEVTPGVNFTLAHNQASPTDFSLSSPSDPEKSSPEVAGWWQSESAFQNGRGAQEAVYILV